MSYIYLQVQGEVSSVECFSDIPVSVLSRLNLTAEKSCSNDSETASCPGSQSGTTSALSTESHGEAKSILSQGDSPVKHIRLQVMAKTLQDACGEKCCELSESYRQNLFSPRMLAKMQLPLLKKTLPIVDTRPFVAGYQRQTWVQTTFGKDFGYVHTPTTKANYCTKSMQKWPSCQRYRQVFGCVTPMSDEWLIGWPIGWTDSKPLAMDRFQQWLRSHGKS